MISICIPIYNHKITVLVSSISSQINTINVEVELVLIDDGSAEIYKKEHRKVFKNFKYIELEQNIGRSKIRNLFTKYATHQYLLFLDCDVELVGDLFIKKYIDAIKQQSVDVVCGGLLYPNQVPKKEYLLRWKYGVKRECRSVNERNENEYSSFMTSNFVIKKDVLETFPFNENIRQYGHEDTLLGFDLKLANKKLLHVNNPVIHADKESNKSYVEKVEKATQNLYHIANMVSEKDSLENDIKLLSYVGKLHQNKIKVLVMWGFKIVKKPLKTGLTSGSITNLSFFDFYKLGVYLEYEHKKLKTGDF